MVEQIYINGVAVDMPRDAVQLSLQSNLLGKADEVTASYSYTLRLPRTLTNDRLIGQAWDAAVTSSSVWAWLPCMYERDGVRVFDGQLAVTGVNETNYDCCLVWGFDGLREMKDEGLKLYEIDKNNTHYNEWLWLGIDPATPRVDNFRYGFVDYESGITSRIAAVERLPRLLPCVSARYILGLINETYGVTLNVPTAADEQIDKLIYALTTRLHYRGDKYPYVSLSYEKEREAGDPPRWRWWWETRSSGQGIINYVPAGYEGAEIWTVLTKSTIKNVRLTAHCNYRFTAASTLFGNVDATADGAGGYSVSVTIPEKEADYGDEVVYKFVSNQQGISDTDLIPSLTASLSYDVIPDSDKVAANQGYPIITNLPDITCMEFITELCAVCGVFPVSMNGRELVCISWDNLRDNPQRLEFLGVEALSFRVNGLAQRNVLSWATDDEQSHGDEDYLNVEDKTLEANGEWFVSHFAALNGAHGVPLYTVQSDTSERGYSVSENNLAERVGVLDDQFEARAYLSKAGLDWATLKANYYTALQRAITRPKVVQGSARLTTLQLKEIDYSRAVYVEPLGGYFAILSIESNGGNIYDVELIKI